MVIMLLAVLEEYENRAPVSFANVRDLMMYLLYKKGMSTDELTIYLDLWLIALRHDICI